MDFKELKSVTEKKEKIDKLEKNATQKSTKIGESDYIS